MTEGEKKILRKKNKNMICSMMSSIAFAIEVEMGNEVLQHGGNMGMFT